MSPRWLSPAAWRLDPAPSSLAPRRLAHYSNADMDPVPPAARTWTAFSRDLFDSNQVVACKEC